MVNGLHHVHYEFRKHQMPTFNGLGTKNNRKYVCATKIALDQNLLLKNFY